jgi:hypothetical protein
MSFPKTNSTPQSNKFSISFAPICIPFFKNSIEYEYNYIWIQFNAFEFKNLNSIQVACNFIQHFHLNET